MNIDRDALLRLVKAARMANKLAEDSKKLLINQHDWTVADEISGALNDVLYIIGGEKLKCTQDFMKDSKTMRLIRDVLMTDREVADAFARMASQSERGKHEAKPHTMEKDEVNRLYEKNGGYMSPEVDWFSKGGLF